MIKIVIAPLMALALAFAPMASEARGSSSNHRSPSGANPDFDAHQELVFMSGHGAIL